MSAKLTPSCEFIGDEYWDDALSSLAGHPLQSALWGNARSKVDGILDSRWLLRQGTNVVWMARVETRRVPGLGNIAWVPRGPTVAPGLDSEHLLTEFCKKLRERGYILAVINPWGAVSTGFETANHRALSSSIKTIWIDLQVGRESLWKDLDKQWRYGVGRATRQGVKVETTEELNTIDLFFHLCQGISRSKAFKLPASAALMRRIIERGKTGPVQARLFVAHYEGRLGAGALILRCGSSVHYLWGATNRELSKQRVGEAVQWAVIEWALDKGCLLYDLEGIDPVKNPGTYQFKKKMGGREVVLRDQVSMPLSLRGRILAWALRNKP